MPARWRLLPILLWLWCAVLQAHPPVSVVLWFDTEDYIVPAADDAALRIATELERAGVRATFKVVGEKARVLEQRGRQDVIRALSKHDIGYHSNYHSIPPAPASYLEAMGWLEGAAEFERREIGGVRDVQRIFGVLPSCYGQPGSSWAPQSYPALRRMGIPVYLDEGTQVGVEEQPFWYGGLLNVFHMGRYMIRPDLNDESGLGRTLERFDRAVEELRARGGGVISTYFHPTEFVTAQFWDAVNFAGGANPERSDWRLPALWPAADAEKHFRVLLRYVEHAKSTADVSFVTARELPQLYQSAEARSLPRARIAAQMAARQTFIAEQGTALSAADMLLALLGLPWSPAAGPAQSGRTSIAGAELSRAAFERAKADASDFIRAHGRLPAEVWVGSQTLALADFAATLAGDDGHMARVKIRQGNAEMEQYIETDSARPFRWPIHPDGFRAPHLLDLARLQCWTLKPAVLK